MAEQKIFAGPRIRRMRNGMNLSQSAMAKELGISPSYLNLIERNQRPLTVQLLLKMASTYAIDLDTLKGESGDAVNALKDVFADPILRGELPGSEELYEVADAAPNVVGGVIKLHTAYKETMERLSDLHALLAKEGHSEEIRQAKLPADDLRSAIEEVPYYFDALDRAAEKLVEPMHRGSSLLGSLRDWLYEHHRISVQRVPIETMPDHRRSFDRHSMRLFILERMSHPDQIKNVAMEVALRAFPKEIDSAILRLQVSSDEAKRLARFEMARYAALAMMMPYQRFLRDAERAKYDIDVLMGRFGASFEHVVNRFATLRRADANGLPFFFLEIDQAGNVIRRGGADGYPRTGFGSSCPSLPVFSAFANPNRLLSQAIRINKEDKYLSLAKTLDVPGTNSTHRPQQTAIMAVTDEDSALNTVYAPDMGGHCHLIGPACRLCDQRSTAHPTAGHGEGLGGLDVF